MRLKIFVTGLALGLACAACSKVELDSFRLPNMSESLRMPSMLAAVPAGNQGPVKPEELVDAQGQCASEPMAAVTPAPGADSKNTDPVTVPPNAALGSTGIGLGMTECDVIKRAGPPEKIVLGANERSERTLTLTYARSMRPGIYGFVAGRLVSIERVEEPPAPAKPVRPAKPAKPKPKPAAT